MILSVANVWNKSKGLYDLVELSNKLQDDELIIMIGCLDMNIVNTLPLNIVWISLTNNQYELSLFYNIANVVVAPSYAESFGMTIIEGMACGTPAVVYGNTALSELVNVDTGYIVPTSNVDELYKAISLIRQKGKGCFFYHCIDKARKIYDFSISFKRYIHLYETLLEKSYY